MMLDLRKIDSNPYRDFDLDPLDPEVVEKMKRSIDELDFWGGLACRRNPTDPGRYQLAFGHHRLEALLKLGKTREDIKVVVFDDDQMVRAMVAENALQRGGTNSASLDSVAAIVRRITYHVLSNSDEKAIRNCGGLFENQAAISMARKGIMDGTGIGQPLISKFDESLLRRAVDEALASLKAGGKMLGLIKAVRMQIEDEALYSADIAASVRAKAEREQFEAQAEQKRAQAEQARKAEANTSDTVDYDVLVGTIFKRDSHNAEFRKVVTSDTGREFIPVAQHVPLAVAILAKAEKQDRGVGTGGKATVLTGAFIREQAMNVLKEAVGISHQVKKQLEKESADRRAQSSWRSYRTSLATITRHLEALNEAVAEGGRVIDGDIDTLLGASVERLQVLIENTRVAIGTNLDTTIVGEQ